MMKVNTRIQLDLYNSDYVCVNSQQGDKDSRIIEIQLLNNGIPYNIPSDCSIALKGVRPDGYSILEQCSFEDNIISYVMGENVLASPGLCKVKIEISKGDCILSTIPFTIFVEKSPFNENGVIGTPQFSILIDAMNRLNEKITLSDEMLLDWNDVKKPEILSAIESATDITAEMESALETVDQATTNANDSAELANTAANLANEKAESANQAATLANDKIALVNSALELITEKANEVSEAVEKADSIHSEWITQSGNINTEWDGQKQSIESDWSSHSESIDNEWNSQKESIDTEWSDKKSAIDLKIEESKSATEKAEQSSSNADSVSSRMESLITTVKENETARNEYETDRQQAELLRISAENERISNESNRVIQEGNRQSSTETAIQNAENATLRANNAAASCEDIISGTNLVLKESIGVPNGITPLGSDGKIQSTYLPSYVDDVIEGISSTNEDGIVDKFVDIEDNSIIAESGKIYIDINQGISYRWTGKFYSSIGSGLTLGETSSTAFPGDLGQSAYTHSTSTHARIDATKTSKSTTNGHIKINDTDVTVYEHPGTHPYSMITGTPTSLPADGGNADTVDGMHADDFAEKSHTHHDVYPTRKEIYGFDKTLVSFIDDDATRNFETVLMPIMNEYGIKPGISFNACIAEYYNLPDQFLLSQELKDLQANGHNLICHGFKHESLSPSMDEYWFAINGDLEYLNQWDVTQDYKVFAYPNGNYSEHREEIAKEVGNSYDYAFNCTEGINTFPLSEKMNLKRCFINKDNGLDYFKDLIDTAIIQKGWLVFSTHSGLDEFSETNLREIIEYIKSKKEIEIVTPFSAFQTNETPFTGSLVDIIDDKIEEKAEEVYGYIATNVPQKAKNSDTSVYLKGLKLDGEPYPNDQYMLYSQYMDTIAGFRLKIKNNYPGDNEVYEVHTSNSDYAKNSDMLDGKHANDFASANHTHEAVGGSYVGASAPSNTKLLWIDTSIGGVLKYYDGSKWTPTKSVWG